MRVLKKVAIKFGIDQDVARGVLVFMMNELLSVCLSVWC